MVVGSEVTPGLRARLTAALRALRQAGAPKLRAFLDQLGAMKETLLRRVPQRFHAITDEIAKFGTIGLINLGVNFAVFNALLVAARGSEVKAKIVATVVAATCAYFLNRYWTYRHRPKTTLRREYSLFFLFNAVGLFIEAAIVGLAKYGFDQTSVVVLNACTFVGIALGTVFRFWAYRTHVFKEAPRAAAANAAAPATVLGSGPVPGPAAAAAPDVAAADAPEAVHAPDVTAADAPEPVHAPDVKTPDAKTPDVTAADTPEADQDVDDDLCDELVQLELDEMLQAQDDPIRR